MSKTIIKSHEAEWNEINKRADDLKFVVKTMSMLTDAKNYNELNSMYQARKVEFFNYITDLVALEWDSGYYVPLKSICEKTKLNTILWYYEPLDIVKAIPDEKFDKE